MKELISFMEDSLDGATVFPKETFPIEGESSLGDIVYIQTYTQLSDIANIFRNCAKTHRQKAYTGDYNLYFIKRDKLILFHINKRGDLVEYKYKANNSLSTEDEKELRMYLRTKIRKQNIS